MALALGRTVAELEATLSLEELAEWERYYLAEPFGPEQEALRIGTLAALTANQHRKKGTPPYKPEDFVLRYQDEKQRDAEMASRLKAVLRTYTAPAKGGK